MYRFSLLRHRGSLVVLGALALWLLSPLGLGAGLLVVSPRGAAAEALAPDTAIRIASLPNTQARGGVRSFAVELADGVGVFDMPEAGAQSPVPAVLILHDASGVDGRAASYAEQLLGADRSGSGNLHTWYKCIFCLRAA